MKKEFVPYELAVKLKALGSDGLCFGVYRNTGELHILCEDDFFPSNSWILSSKFSDKQSVAAPTFSQSFKFFREKYDWQHSIDPTADQHNHTLGYNYWIWNYKTGEEHHTMPKNRPSGDWEYETYEEAELSCLNKLIEIVETKSE